MTMMPALFRYSGSKRKLIPLFKAPPAHKRVAELYLGSGAFSLSRSVPGIGFDANQDIVDLWKFLQTTNLKRLLELEEIRKEAVEAHPNKKPDVRDLKLPKPEETYLRINASGVYVGQLSSWVLYEQWSLPVEQTSSLLDRAREIEVHHASANTYVEEDGDLIFIDPPYVGTKGNYKQQAKKGIEEAYKTQDTVDIISRLKGPAIFTYGTDAKEVFPQYDWQVLLKKKVPNIRRGGTVDRIEHVAYLNWS